MVKARLSENEHINIIKLILEDGAKKNLQLALILASKCGHTHQSETVKQLLDLQDN